MVTLTQATRLSKRLVPWMLLLIALELVGLLGAKELGAVLSNSQDPLAVGLDFVAVTADIGILILIIVEDFFSPFLCDRSPLSRAFTTS